MSIYRQGDLLFIECSFTDGTPVERDQGRIVLAYGETTGHAHAVLDPHVRLFETADERRVLRADAPFRIIHEEHAPVALPQGTFQVVQQREYSPEAIRFVRD